MWFCLLGSPAMVLVIADCSHDHRVSSSLTLTGQPHVICLICSPSLLMATGAHVLLQPSPVAGLCRDCSCLGAHSPGMTGSLCSGGGHDDHGACRSQSLPAFLVLGCHAQPGLPPCSGDHRSSIASTHCLTSRTGWPLGGAPACLIEFVFSLCPGVGHAGQCLLIAQLLMRLLVDISSRPLFLRVPPWSARPGRARLKARFHLPLPNTMFRGLSVGRAAHAAMSE